MTKEGHLAFARGLFKKERYTPAAITPLAVSPT
jgi:hypothetical protein